jgi:predicted dehydrogenase
VLDLTRYVLGDFKVVSAGFENHQFLNVEDTARIVVQLDRGGTGVIDMTWSAGVPARSYFEIYGQDGSLMLDLKGLSYKYKTWKEWKRIDNRSGEKDAFSRQINHFIDTVRGKKQSVITAEDGLLTQMAVASVYAAEEKEKNYVTV